MTDSPWAISTLTVFSTLSVLRFSVYAKSAGLILDVISSFGICGDTEHGSQSQVPALGDSCSGHG